MIAEQWKETQYKLMHRAYSTQLYKRENQEHEKAPEGSKREKKSQTKGRREDTTTTQSAKPERREAK